MRSAIPFFSIIVPVYEVVPYLSECLGSVLGQTFGGWECLCVDDGSRDGSGVLSDAYARRDARIRIVHQRNAGVSAARNRALDVVSGQWVWFVDGDDVIHPKALAMLYDVSARFPGAQAVRFRQTRTQWAPLDAGVVLEVGHTDLGMEAFSQTVWMLLFQREQIGKKRFPGYCVGEDGLFSMRYYFGISRWVDTALPLYYYRARERSVMHSSPTERFVLDWLDMLYERVCLLSPRDRVNMGGGNGLFEKFADVFVVHARFWAFSFAGGASTATSPLLASPCRSAQRRRSLSVASPLGLLRHCRDAFATFAQSPRCLAGLCSYLAWGQVSCALYPDATLKHFSGCARIGVGRAFAEVAA